MNITILGSGNMARGIGARLLAGGNNVTLVARDQTKAQALAEQLAPLAQKGATIKTAGFEHPLTDAVVALALSTPAVNEVVRLYGKQLNGKILVDTSNTLNASFDDVGTPPGTSFAEELQKQVPDARVVKAFNTVFAGLLAQGHVAGQPLDVFIAGDDAQAKATVARLIEEGGLNPVDAGTLKKSRQLEQLAVLTITLQSQMEKPWMTGVKLVA